MICEIIFLGVWEINFSGCVLYVLSLLLLCLKVKFFFYYFILENNFFDCCKEDDIGIMFIIVEYICFFFISVIELIVEKYGFMYGVNLIKSVLLKENYFVDN